MSLSMTGFGRAEKTEGLCRVSMEIRSLNSRYFDIKMRNPAIFAPFEAEWRSLVQEEISRGKIDLRVDFIDESDNAVKIKADLARAKAYAAAYEVLAESLGESDKSALRFVSSRSDIFTIEEELNNEVNVQELCRSCLTECLADFHKMREQEAANLEKQLFAGLERIEKLRGEVQKLAPEVVVYYKKRLLERIAEMEELQSEEFYDGQRVAAEIAIFADKADVTEELKRLASHLEQFKKILQAEQRVGKKLDFLIQEMNRESNTIASKAQSLAMTNCAVDLKSEVEQLREQIQNLE